MTPTEKQILESLQYLLWTHEPRSEMSGERRDSLMVENHLLLNPITKEEPCCEMPEEENGVLVSNAEGGKEE